MLYTAPSLFLEMGELSLVSCVASLHDSIISNSNVFLRIFSHTASRPSTTSPTVVPMYYATSVSQYFSVSTTTSWCLYVVSRPRLLEDTPSMPVYAVAAIRVVACQLTVNCRLRYTVVSTWMPSVITRWYKFSVLDGSHNRCPDIPSI